MAAWNSHNRTFLWQSQQKFSPFERAISDFFHAETQIFSLKSVRLSLNKHLLSQQIKEWQFLNRVEGCCILSEPFSNLFINYEAARSVHFICPSFMLSIATSCTQYWFVGQCFATRRDPTSWIQALQRLMRVRRSILGAQDRIIAVKTVFWAFIVAANEI